MVPVAASTQASRMMRLWVVHTIILCSIFALTISSASLPEIVPRKEAESQSPSESSSIATTSAPSSSSSSSSTHSSTQAPTTTASSETASTSAENSIPTNSEDNAHNGNSIPIINDRFRNLFFFLFINA